MNDLERRKRVRIRFRPDLVVVPQRHEGRASYVVKDPVGLHYYRFAEREYHLLRLLDGRHTLEDIRHDFERHFRPARLSLEEVEAFARQVITAGLATSGTTTGRALLDRRRQQRRSWLGTLGNLFALLLPLLDPDRLLARLLPFTRWLFRPRALLLGVLLMLGALLLVTTHFDVFRARLPAAREFFSFRTAVFLWLALGLVKVLHELGHGLSCKAQGGEVHEMGLLFLFFSPCLYCDVTDAWTLPSRWRRAAVGLAGIYVELLVAAVATFVWWYTPGRPFVQSLSLALMTVCSVNTVLLNGNPLLCYDGYYVLADWLEVPNLRERCGRLLKKLLLRHALGIETVPEPPLGQAQRALFLAYALASPLYRAAVLVGVVGFLFLFLRPYGLGWVGALLAGLSVATALARPGLALVRGLRRREGRLPHMKPGRVVLSTALVLAALGLFFLVSLPVGNVRQVGLVEVQPDAVEPVFVQASGSLVRLHVRDGQRVQAGDLLAEFRNPELEDREAEARCTRDVAAVIVQALRQRAALAVDPQERARIQAPLARALGDCARADEQVRMCEQQSRRLRLRAPRAGVVIGLPGVETLGRSWDKDAATPFCTIADLSRLRVRLPVDPADFRLLQEELARARRDGFDLDVAVHLEGRSRLRWTGQVTQLLEPQAEAIPAALTQWAGGPVPVRSGASAGGYVPRAQHYWVAVTLLDADEAVMPGTTAHVVIRGRGRTLAWKLWRAVCGMFDVGLL
jgi:putative peptide zinc metalloprotease protein